MKYDYSVEASVKVTILAALKGLPSAKEVGGKEMDELIKKKLATRLASRLEKVSTREFFLEPGKITLEGALYGPQRRRR